MPILMNWKQMDPPTMYYAMVDPWTWQQFHEAVSESRRTIESCQFTSVDMIIDWSQTTKLPPHMLSSLSALFQRGSTRSRHLEGRFVSVNSPLFVRVIIETIVRVYPKMAPRVLFASSVDEALTLLASPLPQAVP